MREGVRDRAPRRHDGWVTVIWDTGELDTVTGPVDIPPAGAVHKLARFHDLLLSAPLVRAAGGLPAGSRGGVGSVTLPDGTRSTLHWTKLATALPDGGTE